MKVKPINKTWWENCNVLAVRITEGLTPIRDELFCHELHYIRKNKEGLFRHCCFGLH